ncbi:hypothetical protein MRB53_039670 [Persea americana]|nr:hypothetical protein MRB53_039670 [Persea americana]
MPEAKKYDRSLLQMPKLDWDTFAYKDKQREKQRKADLDILAAGGIVAKPSTDRKRTTSTAWSEKADQKATREGKRTKREGKKRICTIHQND